MPTIGECVGGCADGVQLDPPDPSEPDDWPDSFMMESLSGAANQYRARSVNGVIAGPVLVGGKRVYYFDVFK